MVSPGANARLTEADVSRARSTWPLATSCCFSSRHPKPMVRHAARTAAGAGGVVVLNAAPVPASIDGLFDHVDVLVVNEHELAGIARLLPNQTPDDVSLLAAASGASVVCTLGADGADVPHRGGVHHVAAPQVEAVDTTAAGDTFMGYLAAHLPARQRTSTARSGRDGRRPRRHAAAVPWHRSRDGDELARPAIGNERTSMKIALGNDHAGFPLKEFVRIGAGGPRP